MHTRTHKSKKLEILVATAMLSCLLAFSVLPVALPLGDNTRIIGSTGSITYDDSLPPPPPDFPMDGYYAYSGIETGIYPPWEEGGGGYYWSWPWGKVGDNGVAEQSTERVWRGTYSMRCETWDDGLHRFATTHRRPDNFYDQDDDGYGDLYFSEWLYIDYILAGTWDQFWELRENTQDYPDPDLIADSSVSIFLYKEPSGADDEWYWRFSKMHTGEPVKYKSFVWNVHDDGAERDYTDPHDYPDSYVTVPADGHGVPFDRWFRLDVYLKRHTSSGIFSVWITDPYNPDPAKRDTQTLFSVHSRPTADTNYAWCELGFNKIYGDRATLFYVDEVYFYNFNAHEAV